MELFNDKARILEYFQKHGILVTKEAMDIILERSMGDLIPSMISDEVIQSGYLTENDVLKLISTPKRDGWTMLKSQGKVLGRRTLIV